MRVADVEALVHADARCEERAIELRLDAAAGGEVGGMQVVGAAAGKFLPLVVLGVAPAAAERDLVTAAEPVAVGRGRCCRDAWSRRTRTSRCRTRPASR